jgi:hypothetical protein
MNCLNFGVLLAIIATGQEPDSLIEDPAKYAAAVARGRAEAEVELREGKASVWTFGFGLKMLFENIDRETGLYFRSFGCVIDDEIMGRVKGHNTVITLTLAHQPPLRA